MMMNTNNNRPVDTKKNETFSKYICPECGVIVGVRHGQFSCIMETCPHCRTELNTKGLQ